MIEFPDDFKGILKNVKKVAILTGAGISAESGVPTFRGEGGIWNKFKPEELATVDAFMSNPKLVWEWYLWRRQIMSEVGPNPAHHALVDMESLYDDFSLITQNVDGLHRVAGSKKIYEVHGNISLNKCLDCSRPYDGEINLDDDKLPQCRCGGKIRPDVVWFGEMLPADVINKAFIASERAELFFSIGTSALVHPAASLPFTAKQSGAYLVEVNLDPTPLSDYADYAIHGPAGEIMPEIVEQIIELREDSK